MFLLGNRLLDTGRTGAVNLPGSADLEAGYGVSPEEAAETIRLAIEAGAVGGNNIIEDASGDPSAPPSRCWSRGISLSRVIKFSGRTERFHTEFLNRVFVNREIQVPGNGIDAYPRK